MKEIPTRLRLIISLAVLAVLVRTPAAVGLAAQASATLPSGDPAYRDLATLAHHGLAEGWMAGQRPLSWRAVARLVDAGEGALDMLAAGSGDAPRVEYLRRVIERLSGRVAAREPAPLLAPDDVRADVTFLDSPPHGFPDNGLGLLLDGALSPLAQYQGGRVLRHGLSAALEVGLSGRPASWLAVAARPRAWLARPSGATPGSGDLVADAALWSAYARAVFGNVALLAGRAHAVWGPSPRAGVLISRNARALDMVQVSSDLPFRLPWIFRHLGPARLSFFASDMGAERNFPHTLLFGGKASFLPHPNLEVGLSFLNEQGGEGAPAASFADRVLDLLFLPDVALTDTELTFSEKLAGADVRLRLPELDGLELYLEAAITDIDVDRADEMFREEAAYVAGILLPRLGERGAGSLRLEGYRIGVRPYRHYQFVSGMALDGRLIGNGLGPGGKGATATLTWEAPPSSFARGGVVELRAAAEERSVDLHDVIDVPFPHNIVFIEDRPEERRWRLSAAWASPAEASALFVTARVGAEYVSGFHYVAGNERTNFLARLEVGWRWR